jgi:hypothetical protein
MIETYNIFLKHKMSWFLMVKPVFCCTYLSSQEVVGSCDGVDVSSQVEVKIIHRDHLQIDHK